MPQVVEALTGQPSALEYGVVLLNEVPDVHRYPGRAGVHEPVVIPAFAPEQWKCRRPSASASAWPDTSTARRLTSTTWYCVSHAPSSRMLCSSMNLSRSRSGGHDCSAGPSAGRGSAPDAQRAP